MSTIVSFKTVVLVFGILAVSFLAAFYVVAWTEPTVTPPGGNVPTPLNVGSTGQSKAGGLILNTGGAVNGLVVDKGKVGIGTASPGAKLHVEGNIIASAPIDSSHVATKGYVDAATGGGTLTTWGYAQSGGWVEDTGWVVSTPLPGTGAPACPSGWTEAYNGYGPYWLFAVSYNTDGTLKSQDLAAVSEVCGTNTVQPAGTKGTGYNFEWAEAKACLSGGISQYTARCNTCRVCVK